MHKFNVIARHKYLILNLLVTGGEIESPESGLWDQIEYQFYPHVVILISLIHLLNEVNQLFYKYYVNLYIQNDLPIVSYFYNS